MADNGKPDVDDISLDDARPARKSGGTSAALGFVLLIAIVLVVWFMGMNRKAQMEAEAKAKADAAAARTAQMSQIKVKLEEALTDAAAGNVDNAIAKLEVAENQLGLIITSANNAGDQAAAGEALNQKQAIIDARQGLEAEKVRFQEAISASLTNLRTTFGLSAPAAPATTPDAAAPADATAPAAPEGTPAPVTDPAAPAPAAPVAPEAAPAAPAAPVAPAPVAPAAPAAPAAS